MPAAADRAAPLAEPLKTPAIEFLECGGINIAYRHRAAVKPGKAPLIFLGGYRSDMEGIKAQAIDAFAEAQGSSATRFDYSGHGSSGGDFYQGTISLWLSQSLAVYDRFYRQAAPAPILIGSSMGGWIALRMAPELQKRGAKPSGLILLAPAPDFTESLVKPMLGESERRLLAEKGFFTVNEHGLETDYSRALLEDGPNNKIMGEALLRLNCPIHILQGMEDNIVPCAHTMRLLDLLPLENVSLTLIKDGDHRLSRPQDIAFLQKILEKFICAI